MYLPVCEYACASEGIIILISPTMFVPDLSVTIGHSIFCLTLKLYHNFIWHLTETNAKEWMHNLNYFHFISVLCYLHTGKVFDLHTLRNKRMIDPVFIEQLLVIGLLVTGCAYYLLLKICYLAQ